MVQEKEKIEERPPVIVVMGHVDHGKSTLLDYIRKTNIVDNETGGITQCISAYQVAIKDDENNDRSLTFLDTPGHEAFSKMRERGAHVADIALLIVSAEDGVKAQTVEAYQTIKENNIPFIVVINKIDKPNANIERTKNDLAEKEIYLEGAGGDIPYVTISAKEGTGVKDLLSLIILMADMQELTGNRNTTASGVIIETTQDPKRGIGATCIIKNGTLKTGMFVVSGKSLATTRIFENCLSFPVQEASFSAPVKLIGFDSLPEVGNIFDSFYSKKEAESFIKETSELNLGNRSNPVFSDKYNDGRTVIPIIVKADTMGSIEAIEREIEKINNEEVVFKIIKKGVGDISESDIKMDSADKDGIIVGFNVKEDSSARDLKESLTVTIEKFDIIYKLIDWLKDLMEERRPKQEVKEVLGSLKVLRVFMSGRNKQVVGGRVLDGKVELKGLVNIVRRDNEIGRGKITNIQNNKTEVKEMSKGFECGLEIETNINVAEGDVLECYQMIIK